MKAIAEARALVAPLHADDIIRFFAEGSLNQAVAEAGNGEYDDCEEFAAKASDEVLHPHHQLKPDEALIQQGGQRYISYPPASRPAGNTH